MGYSPKTSTRVARTEDSCGWSGGGKGSPSLEAGRAPTHPGCVTTKTGVKYLQRPGPSSPTAKAPGVRASSEELPKLWGALLKDHKGNSEQGPWSRLRGGLSLRTLLSMTNTQGTEKGMGETDSREDSVALTSGIPRLKVIRIPF